jgi:hypothetical protein
MFPEEIPAALETPLHGGEFRGGDYHDVSPSSGDEHRPNGTSPTVAFVKSAR